MAKYTLEEFMYGDKYGIESTVFVEVSESCCQDDMRTTEYDLCQARTVDSKKNALKMMPTYSMNEIRMCWYFYKHS